MCVASAAMTARCTAVKLSKPSKITGDQGRAGVSRCSAASASLPSPARSVQPLAASNSS
jgi:hypothetical protein